jgi:hypothetical protein
MTTERRSQVDPQAVRSRARGRGFRTALIAAWPASVALGVIGSLIFGGGIAAGVAGGLALALGISFVWVVVLLAVDDGNVDERAREAVRRRDREQPRTQ